MKNEPLCYDIPKEALLIKELFESSMKDIAILDSNARFLYMNESYLNRTGYSKKELLGKKASILKSGFHDDSFYDALWKALKTHNNFNAVFTNKNKNGVLYHEEQTIIPIGQTEDSQTFLVVGTDCCSVINDELNALCVQDI